MFFLSTSNSSQAPRPGMTLASTTSLSGLVLSGRDPEVDARRPHELRHDDALGAVDDEGALVGHHREVPHEDRLLLDLAGGGVHEAGGDEQRAREGHVLLAALRLGVLRRLELVVGELELERAGEVLDRRDVGEDLGDALFEEPLERLALHGDEVGQRLDLAELGERESFPATRVRGTDTTPSEGRAGRAAGREHGRRCRNGTARLTAIRRATSPVPDDGEGTSGGTRRR